MPRTFKPPAVPPHGDQATLGSPMPLAEFDRIAAQGPSAQHSTSQSQYYHPLNGGGGMVSSARSSMLVRSSMCSDSQVRQSSMVTGSPTVSQPAPHPSFFPTSGPRGSGAGIDGTPSVSDLAASQQKLAHQQHYIHSLEAAFGVEHPTTHAPVAHSPSSSLVPAPFASHAFQPQVVPVVCTSVSVGAPPVPPGVNLPPNAATHRRYMSESSHSQHVAPGHQSHGNFHHRASTPSTVFGSPVAMMTPTAGVDEKAMIVAERFRTRMCRHVEAGGVCPYTNHCMFAHTPEQLRTVEANMADNVTSEEAVRDFQHRELVHARKARRVARRRAKLQLARAAKAKDPLNAGSDHDDDHEDHDDGHTTTDHSDHDGESHHVPTPVHAEAPAKKTTPLTEPTTQPRVVGHAKVASAVSPTEAASHRLRGSTASRQNSHVAAHPPPPAYSSSSATSPTNATTNASFTTHAATCCNCQCHLHQHAHAHTSLARPVPVSSASASATTASPTRAAPSVTFRQPQPPIQVSSPAQQQQQPQPPNPSSSGGTAAHQYGFSSDYFMQMMQQQAGQQEEYDEEDDEGEWAAEDGKGVEQQQPYQPQQPHQQQQQPPYPMVRQPMPLQYQPQQQQQQQYSGVYTAAGVQQAPGMHQQQHQPVMPSNHSSYSATTTSVGPSYSQHWSPEHGLGLGATAATMQLQQQQQQQQQQYPSTHYASGFQQPLQPVVASSPTTAGAGMYYPAHQGVRVAAAPPQQQHPTNRYPQQQQQQPYPTGSPTSAYAATPKAVTTGTPTAAGAESGHYHQHGGVPCTNPNHYPMGQVQSQQQLNQQLHDRQHHHHNQYPHPQQHVHPLSADTPTTRSMASHTHSGTHAHQQVVYDAARHIVLVETPVNGPDGAVCGSRTSWRHEPYDLLMPQHH